MNYAEQQFNESTGLYYNRVVKQYLCATRVCTYSQARKLGKEVDKKSPAEDFIYIGDIADDEYIQEQVSIDDILRDRGSCDISSSCTPVRDRSDNIKRSKDKFLDLCYNNQFTHFITFTFDDNKLNGADDVATRIAIQKWCKTLVRTHGMSYVIVPEYHKKGNRIHFHGLLKFDKKQPELVEARNPHNNRLIKKNGRQVYNLPEWDYGYSTCVLIDENYIGCIYYVSKYICKESQMIFGRHYYSGGKLLREPLCVSYSIVDYESVPNNEYYIPHSKDRIKYETRFEKNDPSDYIVPCDAIL